MARSITLVLTTPVARVFQARDLLRQMVVVDLRSRYAGSALGLFWNVIHPLVMVAIYTLVFSRIMGARLGSSQDAYAFSIYLCAGLLPWHGFAEVIRRSSSVLPDNAHLVKKVAFPRALLYLNVLATAAINTLIIAALFIGMLLLSGRMPPLPAVAAWLMFAGLQLVLASGIGMALSVFSVFFRDLIQVVAIVLQLGFWLTPIVYVLDVVPAPVQGLMRLNIVYHFTHIHQGLLLHESYPGALEVVILVVLSAASVALGWMAYRAQKGHLVDEL